jgi:hypothetical protein
MWWSALADRKKAKAFFIKKNKFQEKLIPSIFQVC